MKERLEEAQRAFATLDEIAHVERPSALQRDAALTRFAYQPVEKGVIDRVSRHGEAYRGEGGFAILRDDEDDLNDQDGSSGRNKTNKAPIPPATASFGVPAPMSWRISNDPAT